jgi:hypothetical protein
MNYPPPIALSRAATSEPVRILIIGTRDGIRETIDYLCVHHVCDHADWSKIQPQPKTDDFFSVMTRWRSEARI